MSFLYSTTRQHVAKKIVPSICQVQSSRAFYTNRILFNHQQQVQNQQQGNNGMMGSVAAMNNHNNFSQDSSTSSNNHSHNGKQALVKPSAYSKRIFKKYDTIIEFSG